MDNLQLKRYAIEHGLLKTWARRGRGSPHPKEMRFFWQLMRVGLRLTRLQARGERNARTPIVRRICLAYDTLPEAFCGFRILHLSDLHADGVEGLAECLSEPLRDLEVDLCVLTGDYRFKMHGPCDNVYPPMKRILSQVRARLGVVGILGNHDVSGLVPEFERMGVTMLVNEALELRCGGESAWVIGLDDPHYYGCDDLPRAVRRVPPEAFKILLVHTPEMIEDAAQFGVQLYLCGHTHGGQICLPLIGPVVVHANCRRRYTRGVWRYKNVHGYTCAGVGTSGVPVRFFCPPEIGLIELRCRRHHEHTPTMDPGAVAIAARHKAIRCPPLAEVHGGDPLRCREVVRPSEAHSR